jgi:hypothetical protein
MTKWSDAEFTLTCEGVDFTTVTDIHVTIAQNGHAVDLTGEAVDVVDAHHLACGLTQKQTSGFSANYPAEIQVNWINGLGKRHETKIAQVDVARNLLPKVIGDE